MKYILIPLVFILSGCAYLGPRDYQQYVDSAKSISKDNTVAQTACYNAVTEIAKGGDQAAKIAAIALAEKCKNSPYRIESPKNILGF